VPFYRRVWGSAIIFANNKKDAMEYFNSGDYDEDENDSSIDWEEMYLDRGVEPSEEPKVKSNDDMRRK